MAQLYISKETAVTNRHGREHWLTPGKVAEEGSWVLDVFPSAFHRMAIDYPAPGSDLGEQKPAQHHPAPAAKSEPAPEAAKPEPKVEAKPVAHKSARKG